jgi:hypothetical protein
MGDEACQGCSALHQGVCTQNIKQKFLNKADVPSYSKKSMALLRDIALQILQGLPFSELKQHLLSKYSRDFLNESIDLLHRWLQFPGLMALLLVDTDWFGSCTSTAKEIKGHAFSPSYILEKKDCDACEFRRINKCSLLNAKIFKTGDSIDVEAVVPHIEEMLARGYVSQSVAKESRTIADNNPLAGLTKAVKAARDPRRLADESNFIQNLKNLGGSLEENNVLLFDNEPEAIKEMKRQLYGSEIVVEINPRPEFERIDYLGTLSKGAGIDEYFEKM